MMDNTRTEVYTKTEIIPKSACDAAGAVTLTYLLTCMEQLALADAERIGQGRALLVERYNACWMILTNDITLQRPLHAGEQLQMQTWCCGCRGASVGRDYLFTVSGQEVLRCTQGWVVVNLTTRMLMNPRKMPELQCTPPACVLPETRVRTRPVLPLTKAAECRVTAQDIDINGHMNNARYIVHALPYLPDDCLRGGCRAELCYRSELLEGAAYDCLTGHRENLSEIVFRTGNTDCFFLRVTQL